MYQLRDAYNYGIYKYIHKNFIFSLKNVQIIRDHLYKDVI